MIRFIFIIIYSFISFLSCQNISNVQKKAILKTDFITRHKITTFVDGENIISYPQIYTLKDGSLLSFTAYRNDIYTEEDDNRKELYGIDLEIRLKNADIDSLLITLPYTRSSSAGYCYRDFYDFTNFLILRTTAGSNIYTHIYDKRNGKQIVECIAPVIDDKNEIAVFSWYDDLDSTYTINDKKGVGVHFFDGEYDKISTPKTFFDDCDYQFGTLGYLYSLKIQKKTKHKLSVSYDDCKDVWDR